MLRATLIAVSIVVGCAACGKGEDPLPAKPQLKLDRDSIGFGQEFNSGTYIGQSPLQSLRLENGGQQDLTITSVTFAGPSQFTASQPAKTTLKSKEYTYVQLSFTPTEEKIYEGTLTIVSNADNTPMKTVKISGRGIAPPDAGVSDGGM